MRLEFMHSTEARDHPEIEDAAFARLRKASQTSGRPMRMIAEAVIEAFAS